MKDEELQKHINNKRRGFDERRTSITKSERELENSSAQFKSLANRFLKFYDDIIEARAGGPLGQVVNIRESVCETISEEARHYEEKKQEFSDERRRINREEEELLRQGKKGMEASSKQSPSSRSGSTRPSGWRSY